MIIDGPKLNIERGASLLEYVLLVALLIVVSYGATYRYFQGSTKSFCNLHASLSDKEFNKDVKWGVFEAEGTDIVACYSETEYTYKDVGRGGNYTERNELFNAGVLHLGS